MNVLSPDHFVDANKKADLVELAYKRYLQGDIKWANQVKVETEFGKLTVPKFYTKEEFEEKIKKEPEFVKLCGLNDKVDLSSSK